MRRKVDNKNWVYYQPNKKDIKDEVGDCAIRGLTKFDDISWLEAFDDLVKYARENQTMVNSTENITAFMKDRGIDFIRCYKDKILVQDFAKEHKKGKYMLRCKVGFRGHIVTIENGKYYDTWNSGAIYIYGYWYKENLY